MSNRHLKLVCPKLNSWYSPQNLSFLVPPFCFKSNSLLHSLRPKVLESSLIPLFHISHLVYQQILRAPSYIYSEIQPHFAVFAASSWYKPVSCFSQLTATASQQVSLLLSLERNTKFLYLSFTPHDFHPLAYLLCSSLFVVPETGQAHKLHL